MKKYDTLRIIPNFSCNQRCIFCYQKRFDNNYITMDTIKKYVDMNKLNKTFNNITIMGGEAFLHPNLLEMIQELRKHFKKTINLDTNGAVLCANLPEGKYDLILKNINRLTINFAYPQYKEDRIEMNNLVLKINFMRYLLTKYSHLTIKCNHVFSSKNKDDIKWYFNLFVSELLLAIPDIVKIRKRILITVCEDVMDENNPEIKLNEFIDLINATYSHILPQANIHILTAGLVNVGYFGIKDFNDTDLIVWEDGTTTSFSEYLKMVRR